MELSNFVRASDEAVEEVHRLLENAGYAKRFGQLYLGLPHTREQIRELRDELMALPREALEGLEKEEGAGRLQKSWLTEVRWLKERFDGALRWVRKDHLTRIEGSGNITIGTRVQTLRQRHRSGSSQSGVPAGKGVVVASGTSNRHSAKKAVGTIAAMQVRFDAV